MKKIKNMIRKQHMIAKFFSIFLLLFGFTSVVFPTPTTTYLSTVDNTYKPGIVGDPIPGVDVSLEQIPGGIVVSGEPSSPSNIRRLEFATLVGIGWSVPTIVATDNAGLPLIIKGVRINFTLDTLVRLKVNLLYPAPAGKKWIGFKSNSYSPATSAGTYPFNCRVTWTGGLPVGYQNDSGRVWLSDNSDDLYGEIVNDYYKKFASPHTAIYVKLTMIPEGFYDVSTNMLSVGDVWKLSVRNSTAPYGIVDYSDVSFDSITFAGNAIFPVAPTGKYYIEVKHRNSIETWSRAGGDSLKKGGVTFSYNFTTSASQAYGNNMKLKGSKYCMYSGDVSQDGIVDASDIAIVDNDSYNFIFGYVNGDVTGDGFVDGSDASIIDNNSYNFIYAIIP